MSSTLRVFHSFNQKYFEMSIKYHELVEALGTHYPVGYIFMFAELWSANQPDGHSFNDHSQNISYRLKVLDNAKHKLLCNAENYPFKINKQRLGRSLSG